MDINAEGYRLVQLLQVEVRTKTTRTKREATVASLEEGDILDMSDRLSETGMFCEAYEDGSITKIAWRTVNEIIFLSQDTIPHFEKLVSAILSTPYIGKVASKGFIENRLFEWMVNTRIAGRAERELMMYLSSESDSACQELEYFFPLSNVQTDVEFSINDVEIMFFKRTHLDEFFADLNKDKVRFTEDQFSHVFRNEFQGKVLVKATVYAETGKAAELAKQKAELAIDVLKISTLTFMNVDLSASFDLNYRLNYQFTKQHLSKPKNSEFGYAISLNFSQRSSYTFTEQNLKEINRLCLQRLSDFIKLNRDDELYRFILSGIAQFSFAYSIQDLHRRSIELISVLETILLTEEDKYKMEDKTLTRMSKLLPGTFDDKQKAKEIVSRIYAVRHKMIHKSMRLDISHPDIKMTQVYVGIVLIRLIELNIDNSIIDKTTLISKLNAQIN